MKPNVPRTYDEITRRTVVDPDSSYRLPVPPEAPHVVGLHARVVDALKARGFYDVGCEVSGAQVFLRGEAPDVATRDRIERLVAAIEGVEAVESRMSVGSARRGS